LQYSQDLTQFQDWELLQRFVIDEPIEIQVDHWKKVARKLNVLDVKAYDFVSFIGKVCSVMKECIITMDNDILWIGSDGQKTWDQINPFRYSSDRLPEAIYFILPVSCDVVLEKQKKSMHLEVHNDKGIGAIKAALENETNLVVVQQKDVAEEPVIGAEGFMAIIVKEMRQKDGSYTIRVKPTQKVVIKELLRSPTCLAAKIETQDLALY